MTQFYKSKPPPAIPKPVGVRSKAYVRTRYGASRIVTDTYGSKTDWFALSKEIKKRDNYKCIFCGKPEDPKAGVFHDVHHIKRLADGGTTTRANLGTTCEDCHKKRPGHSHMRQRR